MADLFSYNDYIDYINAKIEVSSSIRGYQSKLAEAAGCQTSYLSRVLNRKIHLTHEHGASLCRYWSFDSEQSNFFLQLVHLGRAGSENLRQTISYTIESIRLRNQEINSAVKLPSLKNLKNQVSYYSKWQYAAIHMMILIKSFNSVSKISQRLRIPQEEVNKILSDLEKMGLIKQKGTWYRPTKTQIHLPRTSPLIASHHTNWHLKAMNDIAKNSSASLHYSAIHSLSKDDIILIKKMIVGFIKSVQKTVTESDEEDIACFSCSFFQV